MASQEYEMDVEGRLVSMVMEGIPSARFALICDDHCNIMWNSKRNNVDNILSLGETKKSLMRALESWKDRNGLSSKIGKGRYAVAVYEKIKRVTVPLSNGHMLFVSLEEEEPTEIENIITIVKWVENNPSL